MIQLGFWCSQEVGGQVILGQLGQPNCLPHVLSSEIPLIPVTAIWLSELDSTLTLVVNHTDNDSMWIVLFKLLNASNFHGNRFHCANTTGIYSSLWHCYWEQYWRAIIGLESWLVERQIFTLYCWEESILLDNAEIIYFTHCIYVLCMSMLSLTLAFVGTTRSYY